MLDRMAQANQFAFEKQAGATPYRQQGSHKFDAPEMMQKRDTLCKESAQLRQAALQFWGALGKAEWEHMTFTECASPNLRPRACSLRRRHLHMLSAASAAPAAGTPSCTGESARHWHLSSRMTRRGRPPKRIGRRTRASPPLAAF